MRLYKVNLILVVQAEDADEAWDVATNIHVEHYRDDGKVIEVCGLYDLPEGWDDSIPYSVDNDGEKTCGEILVEKAER